MKTLILENINDFPDNFTGIITFKNLPKRKEWYKNGLEHCEDGPAIEWEDGRKSYFLNGRHIGENEGLYWFIVLTFVRNKKKIPEKYFKSFDFIL